MVLLAVCFTVLGVNELLDENSFVLQRAVARNWYSQSDVFPEDISEDSALAIAFGIIDLDSDGTDYPTLDESIGTLEVYYRERDDNIASLAW